jgi:hypothetical protein
MQSRDNHVVYYFYSIADFVCGLHIDRFRVLKNVNQYPN